jgi:hypothetical protein
VKGSAEPRGVVPRSQDAVDKIAAEALDSFCTAAAYFTAARRLIASGTEKEGEPLPVPMPYTRSGRRRLARLLGRSTYGPCEGALEAANIEDGTRVILGLTLPMSAISIRHDDWTSIKVFVGEALPPSVVVALELRVCWIAGSMGVVLKFVHDASGRDSAPASHQKYFIRPEQLFRLVWVLSQETDIRLLSSECQNEAQTAVLVEPIMRLANRLKAELPEAEPLDVAAIDRGALAAVLAARTMVQQGSVVNRGVSPRTVRLARERLLEIASAVDTIAGSGHGVSFEMLAYTKLGAALCRQTLHQVDVWAEAGDASVSVDVCWKTISAFGPSALPGASRPSGACLRTGEPRTAPSSSSSARSRWQASLYRPLPR